jgi:intracellular septation protein A
LVPLVAFYLVESWYGLRAGTIVAIVLAAIEVMWTRWRTGRVPRMTIFTAGLIVLLGGLSLYSEDERFVLYTPIAGDLIFAAVLALSTVTGSSLLEAGMREQDPEADLHPLEQRFLRQATQRFALNLLAHAGLTAWSVDVSREMWLLVSGPVQYGMFGVQLAAEIAWGRWVVGPRVDADLDAQAQHTSG